MKLRPIGKKADLSLSINAIVILILAMVLLGLAIPFINSLFKQASEKVSTAFTAADLTNPPNSDHPLTVDRQVTASPGDKKQIQIGIYNDNPSPLDAVIPKLTSCINSAGTQINVAAGNSDGISLTTGPQPIAARGIGPYNAVLSISSGTAITRDTYICTVGAYAGTATTPFVSAQFFITVT